MDKLRRRKRLFCCCSVGGYLHIANDATNKFNWKITRARVSSIKSQSSRAAASGGASTTQKGTRGTIKRALFYFELLAPQHAFQSNVYYYFLYLDIDAVQEQVERIIFGRERSALKRVQHTQIEILSQTWLVRRHWPPSGASSPYKSKEGKIFKKCVKNCLSLEIIPPTACAASDGNSSNLSDLWMRASGPWLY